MRSDQYSISDSLEECEAIITTCEDSKFAPRGEVTWPLSRARLSAFTLIKRNSTSSPEKQVLQLLFNTLLLAEGRKKKIKIPSTTNHSYEFWDSSPATEGLGGKKQKNKKKNN